MNATNVVYTIGSSIEMALNVQTAKTMSSRARFERAIALAKREGRLSRQTETETGQKPKVLKDNTLDNKKFI
jgi:hypothetical protein